MRARHRVQSSLLPARLRTGLVPILAITAIVAASATPGIPGVVATPRPAATPAPVKASSIKTVASVSGLPSACSASAGNPVVTCSWGSNVSATFAVPAGAYGITYTAAAGGAATPSNSGAAGKGSILTGSLGNVANTTLQIGTGQQGGGNPNTTYGNFSGGGAGSGAGGGHDGDHGGAATIIGSGSTLLVVAGGGGGGGGNYSNTGGGRGGDGSTGGSSTGNRSGGGGASRSSGSFQYGGGGGGGGGGYWAGNGGGTCNGCAAGGGEGGSDAVFGDATMSRTDGNAGNGSVSISYYRTSPTISYSAPSSVYAWQRPLTIPFTVSGGSGTPTGTVTVSDGSTQLCSVTLSAGAGSCTLASSRLTTGTHNLQFSYGGDTGFVDTSRTLSMPVQADPNTVTATATPQSDGSYTLVATVTPTQRDGVADGHISWSGSQIPALASCTGRANLALTDANVDQNRGAALALTCVVTLAPGDYSVSADYYAGAASIGGSQPLTVSVAKYVPSVRLSMAPTSLDHYGATTTATVAVTAPTNAVYDPAGSVTVAPTSGSGTSCTQSSGTTVNHVTTYTCTVTPAGGDHDYAATFHGGTYYADASSSAITVSTVSTVPTLTLTPRATTIPVGQTLTLDTAATSPDGSAVGEGTVTVYDGPVAQDLSNAVGTVDLAAHPGGGSVTITPNAGTHVYTAQYTDAAGSTNYAVVTVQADAVYVQPLEAHLGVDAVGDAAHATAAGIPTTVTATLSVPTQDTLTKPITVTPAPASACTRSESSSNGKRYVTVTCQYVRAPGTTPSFTASYTDDLVATVAATQDTYRIPASPTATTASATSVQYGDEPTLSATVTPVVSGAAVSGSVTFTEGATTLCTATLGGSDATCVPITVPTAGTHAVTATYAPDASAAAASAASTSAAASYTVRKAPVSIALSTSQTSSKLTVSVVASVDSGVAAVPAGSIEFADFAASCGTVTLVDGLASCVLDLPAAGSKSRLTATYDPSPNFVEGSTPSVTKDYQRPVSGPCSGGFAALWAAAKTASGHGPLTIDAGALGSVKLSVDSGVGDCDAAGTLAVTADVSLFAGTLKASSVHVSVDQTSGLCLTSGSLALPSIWNSNALAITQAICFPLTSGGGIAKPVSGTLALARSGGSGAPLVAIPGVTGPASLSATLGTACPGKDVGAGTCDASALVPAVTLTGRVAAVSSTVPGVTVTATVGTDGSIAAAVSTTAVSVLGASVQLTGTASRTGTGTLAVAVSATLANDASPVSGLTLLTGATLTLTGGTGSSPTLAVAGTVRVAGGSSSQVDVAVSGSFSSPSEFHLALASSSPAPSWTPISGLTLSPVLAGTLDRTAGATTFSLSATGSGGSPLATWAAPGGVSVAVNGVSLGGDPTATDLNCPYTSGLVLAMSGSMSIGGLSVGAAGCVSLGDKSWHVGATARTSTVGGLALTNLVLNATHPAGGTTSVTGSATATLTVGTFSGSTTVTMSADDTGFVIGGRIDATSLGLPSTSVYLAYASSARTGWQTGLPKVGVNGTVDLPAGVSLFGSMALPTAVATVLRGAHFSLSSDATVTFEAVVPVGATGLTFTAQLATPSGFPLLTLPGGATVTSVSIVYADKTFGLTADGTVKGQDGSSAPVHLAVTIASDGSLTGSGSVTGLNLFGRTLDLTGAVSRTAAGVFSANLSATLTGQVKVGDAVLHDVTVGIGTGGLAATGSIDVANTTLAFTASFASTSSYSLTVSTTIRNWSPASGVTVNAVVSGAVTRTVKGYSYDFTVLPVSGATGLLTITPVSGVTLALTSFELSNGSDLPVGCSVSTAGDTWLAVSGSLSFSVGGASATGSGSGCFDLTHPAFQITVQVPSASFGGAGGKVTLSNLSVTIGRDSSGFTAQASGRLGVQMPSGGQFSIVAVLTLGPDGYAIGGQADLSSFLGGSAAQAYLYYANTSITVDTGDPTLGKLKLKPGVTAGLKFTVGDNVASALKTIGIPIGAGSSLAATANLDLANATVVLNVGLAFTSTNLISTSNGTYLRLDTLALAMTLSPTQPSFGFQTSGTLHVPASVPGGAASDVGLSGGIRIGTELSAYLTVSNWNDAFGLTGLNLQSFTLQGGITLTGLPLPSLAVQANVNGLPSKLANVIGYQQGAPISISLAIGETNLLFDVRIGSKDSQDVALAPFSAFGKASLLTVNYAELYLSPTGATIGDQVYPAGFSIAFQGKIVGVSVDVFAKVDPVNLSLYFRGSVGTISLGSLVIGPTTLTIDAAPTRFNLSFSGHLAIGPSVTQIGPALRIGGYLKSDATFSIGTSGISAKMNFDASVYSSDYLPRSWCESYGFYYPCNWGWVDTPPLTIHADNIGFAIDSSGFTVDVPNTSSSITFPWPSSPLSTHVRSLTGGSSVQAVDIAAAGGLAPVRNAARVFAPVAATWHPTGSLGAARVVAGGLALRDGSVLIAGGSGAGSRPLATAELYDPRTGGWKQTASMHTARINPTMIELRDGRVLVAGGSSGTGSLASAEIYDPTTGTWSEAGALSQARQSASAALLPDGSVLVAGGHVQGRPVTTVDRFVPSTGRWVRAASLPSARAASAVATLADGRVLLIGGMGPAGPLKTVVRYDPATSTWHAAAPMANARFYASATRLASGSVLVAGGAAAAERYDPATDRWSQAGALSGPTLLSTMTTTADGDVLVAGGLTADGSLTQVDRYDPSTNHWTAQASLPSPRAGSVAAALSNGRVLVAGGLTGKAADARSYLYTTDTRSVRSAPYVAQPVSRAGDSAFGTWMWILLGGGLVLLLVAMLFLIARRHLDGERTA